MGRRKPLGALNSSLSHTPQLFGARPVSLFTMLFVSPPAPTLQQSPWGVVAYTGSDWGALIHIWRPESTDGCDIFCLLIRQETASLVAQMVKNLSAMQETWVQSLGREDLLEKKMAAPSSILAWRIPWTEEPGGVQSMVWQRAGHN